MDQIEFADGFDRPDQIAFGLDAGRLAVVMGGALAAYSLVRSPVSPAFADPLAVVIAAAAAGLGWIRVDGRPALDWAVFAARFWLRPRTGTVWCGDGGRTSVQHANDMPAVLADASTVQGAPIIDLFAARPASPVRRLAPSVIPARRDGARRVTFFSLRGGTGRSTLATELACLLAALRSDDHPAPKVALVDLDLRSPTVAVRLGTPEKTLLDFALAPPEDRRVVDFMVLHASGAYALLGPQRAVNPEWPVTPALVREVLRELDLEGFDLVVLDVSPELSAVNTTALSACDDVFVVVVPTAGGVQDAYRSTETLRRLGLRHQLRYVINRSRSDTDMSEAMADLGGQLLGDIPEDDALVAAENAHRVVGLDDAGLAAVALRRLARRFGSELRATWPG
jgi:MinD-like ATPase involved in chromosome partitioning or flagellar assembly